MTRTDQGPAWVAALIVIALGPVTAHADDFIRGDVTSDGRIDLSDLTGFAEAFRNQGANITCLDALDVDDDGSITFLPGPGDPPTDFLALATFLLTLSPQLPAPQLAAPFPFPGPDPVGNDNFDCADGLRDPAPPPAGEFEAWLEAPTQVRLGEEGVEVFFRATTGSRVEGLAIALLIDEDLELTALDLQGTIVPDGQGAGGSGLPLVAAQLVPSGRPRKSLLLAVALFFDETAALVDFSATQGPVVDAPFLRLEFAVADDADTGERSLIEVFPGPYAFGFNHLGGLKTGFASGPRFTGLDTSNLSISPVIVTEPGKLLFVRGDANIDGFLDVSDAVHTLNALFTGGAVLAIEDAADSNDDGQVDIADPVSTLNFLFIGGRAPAPPYPNCGLDPTDDDRLFNIAFAFPECP